MFPSTYYAATYFPSTFFAEGSFVALASSTGGFFPPAFFARAYFARTMFPSGLDSVITPEDSTGGYFPPTLFAPTYFAPNYFPGGSSLIPIPPSLVTLKVGLTTAIKADSALAALIGTRFYPDKLPPRARRPAIVYHVLSDARGAVLAGQTRQRIARVLFECQAYSDEQAEAIARAIDGILSPFSAGVAASLGGCDVRTAFQQPEAESYEIAENGTDRGVYVRLVDYRIDYRLDL